MRRVPGKGLAVGWPAMACPGRFRCLPATAVQIRRSSTVLRFVPLTWRRGLAGGGAGPASFGARRRVLDWVSGARSWRYAAQGPPDLAILGAFGEQQRGSAIGFFNFFRVHLSCDCCYLLVFHTLCVHEMLLRVKTCRTFGPC